MRRDVLRRSAIIALALAAVCLVAHFGSRGPGILKPVFASEKTDADQARCLAKSIYWEARKAGREVMTAVAWVVLNRRKSSEYPDTICAVVHQGGEQPPCQFSYWCDGQPEIPHNASAWKMAEQIAATMLNDPPKDPTHGALFFHTVGVEPAWARNHKRTLQLGKYIFYR